MVLAVVCRTARITRIVAQWVVRKVMLWFFQLQVVDSSCAVYCLPWQFCGSASLSSSLLASSASFWRSAAPENGNVGLIRAIAHLAGMTFAEVSSAVPNVVKCRAIRETSRTNPLPGQRTLDIARRSVTALL